MISISENDDDIIILKNEIENKREMLNSMIDKKCGNISDDEIMNLSRILDKLLATYIKKSNNLNHLLM